jgi:hypothetical protein
LVAGNRFRVIDPSNNNLGDYIVSAKVGINTFTAITNKSVSASYILKHGLSANEATSDVSAENLGTRGVTLFDEETLTVVSFTSDTQIRVSSPVGAAAITKRFPLGSYIQIDDEIMRVVSSTLGGTFNDELAVIRGALATLQSTHEVGSRITKIKPIAIEFRRPSIARASGHTFEYLGYGPGNYSTGLPQVQVTTLSEREEFLVQSQERSGGIVVYNGINSNGDVFNGNTKTSASSGEILSYDIPNPTITGEDPNRLSVVFDEVTIKERLVVEGGNSSTVLSQFNGPVTFNKEVKINDTTNVTAQLKVTNTTQSTTTKTGSLVVSGGAGIAQNLNVGGNTNIAGTLGVTGATTLSNNLDVTGVATFRSNVYLGDSDTIYLGDGNDLAIYHNGTDSYIDDQGTGSLYLRGNTSVNIQKYTGENMIVATADGAVNLYYDNESKLNTISTGCSITGELVVTGDITAFYTSDQRLKDNIVPIPDALNKVLSISGNTFNWNEKSGKEGTESGVIAQEILEVLPEAVTTRDNGYLAVHYDKLVPLLIEAIKELKAEVEDLKGSK